MVGVYYTNWSLLNQIIDLKKLKLNASIQFSSALVASLIPSVKFYFMIYWKKGHFLLKISLKKQKLFRFQTKKKLERSTPSKSTLNKTFKKFSVSFFPKVNNQGDGTPFNVLFDMKWKWKSRQVPRFTSNMFKVALMLMRM